MYILIPIYIFFFYKIVFEIKECSKNYTYPSLNVHCTEIVLKTKFSLCVCFYYSTEIYIANLNTSCIYIIFA